nr:uncharacterized protein LOC113696678 [Coffea arabica]
MTDLLAHVVEHQGQNPSPQPENPGNPDNFVESEDRVLERFQKFFPPKFNGGPDPDVAERWLEKMVDIFAALHYTEERQWEREQTPKTLVNFMREFNAKFFPHLIQERKEDEFIRLHQGTQTVPEYESQFTRLSKFAPELIVTKQRRIRRFVQGLNVEIQKDLAVAPINTFSEAEEKAQRVESARLQVRNFQDKKQGFPGSSSGQGNKGTPPKFGRGTRGGRQPGMWRGARQGTANLG